MPKLKELTTKRSGIVAQVVVENDDGSTDVATVQVPWSKLDEATRELCEAAIAAEIEEQG